jgi:release factor glutamine methyltransferase
VAEALRRAGIDNPRLEARLLVAHAHAVSPAALLRGLDAPADLKGLAPLIARRAAHEPLALILGRREFWGLEFAVSSATLIPRPDSETLLEASVAAFADRQPPRSVLDLGTGTGCLLLAALSEFPAAFGIGVDISAEATALAARNAVTLGLADRALFCCGYWADALAARFDLVLSNPPYIRTGEFGQLMPEVARHEPRSALDGGADGLAAYGPLLAAVPQLLGPEGVAVLELGAGQAEMVGRLARRAGLLGAIKPDLAGIPRALVLRPALP